MKMKACRADFGVAEVKPVQLKVVLNQHLVNVSTSSIFPPPNYS